MSDDGAAEEVRPGKKAPDPSWVQKHGTVLLVAGCVGLCGVIVLDVMFMLRLEKERATGVILRAAAPLAPPSAAAAPAPNAANDHSFASPVELGESQPIDPEPTFSDDGEPRQVGPTVVKHYATVQQAAVGACTTASVAGLSRQVIEQGRCIKPNAFVPLPKRPNLTLGSQVFPYLEREARDHLVQALDARRGQQMTINSALRTVVQQYLVWRWSATKRCGVPLATPPGESNHELGVALDIAQPGAWRAVLASQNFHWLGSSDRVHFDYQPKSEAPGAATDVLAFQVLWNRNNPTDKLEPTGRYDHATEERLKQAPPDGFKRGPSCGK